MLFLTVFCILFGFTVAGLREVHEPNLDHYHSNIGETAYQLKNSVYPHMIRVDLDVNLNESYFNGTVSLDVEVRESNLTRIAFHQKVESIRSITITSPDNSSLNTASFDAYATESHYELIIINSAQVIAIGNYTITIQYVGKINDNPYDGGLYRGYYFNNSQEITYATTQFAPYFARRAFPCFDEPQFKSRFVISITRDSSLQPSYSNMPIADTMPIGNNRVREIFHPTPEMAAYLVAILISDFEATNLTSTAARNFRIISRRGLRNWHDWAANIGVRATNVLDDFFGIIYHEMGQGVVMKNDHIAIPDFTFSAMENWGMVTYREGLLMYDPYNNNLQNKISIATLMTHEMTHKWFGNLVTTFWWSNVWINEAFASYFGYFGAHWAEPSFELDSQFVTNYVHNALASDSQASATPMNWEGVGTTASILSHFSTTSYDKGASVLRMMEHFVGSRNFKVALRYYLRDNAYKSGTPEAVYAAFRRAVSEDFEFIHRYGNVDVGTIFDSWVQNPGSPVVHVEVNTASGDINVSQKRYVISGIRPNATWYIPLTWTNEAALNFDDTRPTTIFSRNSTILRTNPGPNWVIFNIAQSGLYRVSYNEATWYRIGRFLTSSNRTKVHRLNRAQIANDLLYFVRSRDANTTMAFTVLEFLKDETDYYVWNAAIAQLELILRRFEHLPDAYNEFRKYLLNILENVIEYLGYEDRISDSTSDTLNRMQIMNLACNLGHTGCVKDSLEKWKAYQADEVDFVRPNYRRYVYCVGLREGNASDYQILFDKFESSEHAADMTVMLRALGCTRDSSSFQHFLQQTIVNRKIRVHDRTNVFNFALQGNAENQPLVIDFVKQNFTEIRNTYGRAESLNLVISSLTGFMTNFTVIEEFHTWVYANQVALNDSFNSSVSGINSSKANLEWGNANAPEIYRYLLARSSSTTIVASTILLLIALFTQF